MSIILDLLSNPAFAQAGEETTKQSFLASFAPLVAIIIVFYFLIIRPQNKKMKDHQLMLTAVSKGDKVITNSGIYATVARVELENNIVILEISENVKIKVKHDSISEILNNSSEILESNSVKITNKKKTKS